MAVRDAKRSQAGAPTSLDLATCCHRSRPRFPIRQIKALLGNVHASMRAKSDRRASAFQLTVERLDQFMQLRPRRDVVDLCKEHVAPGHLLLGCVFEVGETLLHDQLCCDERGAIVSVLARVTGSSSGGIYPRRPGAFSCDTINTRSNRGSHGNFGVSILYRAGTSS